MAIAHGHSHGGHGGGHAHHITPKQDYVKVILILMVLTVVTVLAAKPVSGFDLGILNTFVAMLIATVKAGFVLSIFMGLRKDDRLYLICVLLGVFFLIVMFAFCWVDIITRLMHSSPL